MKKIFKTRNKCRLCNSKKIKQAIDFGDTIIAEKYLDNIKSKKSLSAPMKIFHCLNCSHVQLVNIVDPNYLWNNFTFKTKNNAQLVQHFQRTAKRILKNLNFDDFRFGVLDIGSNDGSLLKAFKSLKVNKVLGIDPAKNIVEEANNNGIKTILGYFGKDKLKQINSIIDKPKIITAFNAFAHSKLHEAGTFESEAS